jgi:hypothetical protein
MFITLTNSSPTLKGNPIVLNTDFIVSIFRTPVTRMDYTVDEVTYINCPPHGTWEVQESVEEVVALIEKSTAENALGQIEE